ncbi:MAG TPA: hypothetical protein VF988_01895 [Verrucomicrobiae bacterium]
MFEDLNVKPMETQELHAGQLWRLKRRYVRILEAGRQYVHFKMLSSPDDPGERVLTSEADCLWRYLISRKGRLI